MKRKYKDRLWYLITLDKEYETNHGKCKKCKGGVDLWCATGGVHGNQVTFRCFRPDECEINGRSRHFPENVRWNQKLTETTFSKDMRRELKNMGSDHMRSIRKEAR